MIKAYVYDDDGYLSSETYVQESPLEKGVYLLPANATLIAPECDPAYFYRFDVKSQKWEKEKIPTEPSDFEGMVISHTSRTAHDSVLRQKIQELIDSTCTTHRIVRGDNLEWIAEKIPEKTAEELQAEAEASVRAKRDYLLAETDYLLAADYPISDGDLAAIKTYRQALRDVPQQEGFPNDVIWPELPSLGGSV